VDVRAKRKVDDITVGIEVSGSALRPQLAVWSDPALDQAEALSYLVLGRPLRSASSADSAKLGQAAAAIGGNLLAGRLGARLGFDTFGVADSQALGGAAFTVGKFLSPALYLSYGVSLFGSGQVVTLRYLLSEQFDIEIESGSESRAGFNYRIER
jgi:translocation and assembly module TamB